VPTEAPLPHSLTTEEGDSMTLAEQTSVYGRLLEAQESAIAIIGCAIGMVAEALSGRPVSEPGWEFISVHEERVYAELESLIKALLRLVARSGEEDV
jgi:hypothetical protein